ncbi:MAG: 30S ribosomal protein S7 [Verrucomicrobiales bacterium]|jgi:small subunit ribosomal protein S7|nr:30S ribosomal protein S7 [Verrucomicrobiales bacterium]
MARRRKAEKRQIIPDPVYENQVVGRLISAVMECGKKSIAQKIVYNAIEQANKDNKEANPLDILNKAVETVKPRLEVKSRRVGGATYQVPMEVPAERQLALAMRWIVGNAKNRKGVAMAKALAIEIKEAAAGQGNAIKKRDDVHRMAQANKAFAHLRW